MKRVLIVANKYWECDGVASALLNESVRDPALPWPHPPIHQPRRRDLKPPVVARLVYEFPKCRAEVWCVSDFLENLDSTLQSSSEQKALALPKLFDSEKADMLIAVGTAGFPTASLGMNGGVTVGTNVFMHNGHPNGSNKLSNWTQGPFDTLVKSTLSEADFKTLTDLDLVTLSNSFVKTPNEPATPACLARFSNVSLGTINVTDYSEYNAKDAETVAAFGKAKTGLPAASVETTHGILRALGPSKFMFVSGITDGFGHFNDVDNTGQNFAASFNVGVVLSGILARLNSIF